MNWSAFLPGLLGGLAGALIVLAVAGLLTAWTHQDWPK